MNNINTTNSKYLDTMEFQFLALPTYSILANSGCTGTLIAEWKYSYLFPVHAVLLSFLEFFN